MFTVLIAESEHIDAIQQENKLFFEPFLENRELAFCRWNPSGQTLSESVPGLLDAVGRRKIWRAIILHGTSSRISEQRNPFDITGCQALDALSVPERQPEQGEFLEQWEASWNTYFQTLSAKKNSIYQKALEHPLQKLATWLCFRPEDYISKDHQEKPDVEDWAMQMIGRDNQKASVRMEILEREQYKRELRMKEGIRRKFIGETHLNIAHPAEVYCIAPRAAENNFFDPDAYWTLHQENEYSSFADRNMYFDRMRFMVFDMLARSHRNFRTDYIRFLASVLIFASNPVPGSALQARRLYRLEAEADDTPLCTMAVSYDRKLAVTCDVIENEMETIRSQIPAGFSDKEARELFCTSKDLTVLLDESCDPEKVLVQKDYGLFFDRPENERHKWNRDQHASVKELEHIVRQQARSIRKAAGQLRASSKIADANISRLTPAQVEDIREYTDAAENEMTASIPPDLTDISIYRQRLSRESEKVKKVIGRRMTRKTAVILSAVCLSVYFFCLLPFLFANHSASQEAISSISLAAGALTALALILLTSLFFLRSSVTQAIRSYNQKAREILREIHSSLNRFSKYLSASYAVRRGHAIQNCTCKNLDTYTRSLRIRKKHLEDIRRRRAELAEHYGEYLEDRSCYDETICRPYEYDFDQPAEYSYPAPFLSGDCRQIEFISSGNLVTVPSSYITRIFVRMEGIYEN